MIASAHLAAGIVIGLASDHVARGTFTRISAAFVTGVIVHLLMDAVPHSDYDLFPVSTMWFVIAGEFLAVLIIAAIVLRDRLTPHWLQSVAAGLLGSVLPDAKFIAPFFLPASSARLVESYGNRLHNPFHASANSAVFGMVTQLSCTILLLVVMTAFPRTRA